MIKNKSISLIVCVLVMLTAICNIAFAKGAWKKVGDNWRYENHAGSGDYVIDKFRTIYDLDGITAKTYYFDFKGNMVTGPMYIKNGLYVFDENGAAITTGFDIDGVHYNTEGNGRVVGLPSFFDMSRFPAVHTVGTDIAANIGQPNLYDDNNNIMPTAPAGN